MTLYFLSDFFCKLSNILNQIKFIKNQLNQSKLVGSILNLLKIILLFSIKFIQYFS